MLTNFWHTLYLDGFLIKIQKCLIFASIHRFLPWIRVKEAFSRFGNARNRFFAWFYPYIGQKSRGKNVFRRITPKWLPPWIDSWIEVDPFVVVTLDTTCSIHGFSDTRNRLAQVPRSKKIFPDPLVVETCNVFSKKCYTFSPTKGSWKFFFERRTCANRFLVPETPCIEQVVTSVTTTGLTCYVSNRTTNLFGKLLDQMKQ